MKHEIFDHPGGEREIITPGGGWKSHTYYLVRVAYSASNPIHYAILGAGFVRGGIPGNLSALWSTSYDAMRAFSDVYFLEVERELCSFN